MFRSVLDHPQEDIFFTSVTKDKLIGFVVASNKISESQDVLNFVFYGACNGGNAYRQVDGPVRVLQRRTRSWDSFH